MSNYALIGEKLGHSYSKIIHKMYFELCGMHAEYDLVETDRDNLKTCFAELKKSVSGFNVTIPYKQDIISLVDSLSDEAHKIGAVNTVKFTDDAACGYNTDYYGLTMTFKRFGIPILNKKVVILGTGGASKAVCTACRDSGAKEIVFVSRNPGSFGEYEAIGYNDKIFGDVMINATPVGMYPKTGYSPISDIENGFEAVFDLIYNPSKTELMKNAEQKGIKAVNGLYMLVAQAMRSQEIWNDNKVGDDVTDKIYQKMLDMFKKGDLT